MKNARMTKKGKSYSNVANGVVIDTLVILSIDLVQVIAKVCHNLNFYCFVSLLNYLMPCKTIGAIQMWSIIQGIRLPADGVAGNMAGDDTEAILGIVPSEHLVSEAKKSTKSVIHKKKISQTRYSHFGIIGQKY